MKYKLLLIAICITITKTGANPTKGRPWADPKQNELGVNTQNRDNLKPIKVPGLRTRIRVDKNGKRWSYDENSREWMHLPKQQSNPLGMQAENREDLYPDQSMPDIFSPIHQQKGQNGPGGLQINSQSIYGPQYPSSFPNVIVKPVLDDSDNYVPISRPIYGPLPHPGGFEPTEEEESESIDGIMPWNQLRNFSHNFPIPGGPNHPVINNNLGKPLTQNPVRNDGREKPSILEEFEDPFETETGYAKPQKNVKKIIRLSTSTEGYEGEGVFPHFSTSFDLPFTVDEDDFELGPIVPVDDDGDEDSEPDQIQADQRQKGNPVKKHKPIVKIPISPQEEPNFWTVFEKRTTALPSTTTEINNQDNTKDEIVELYPPVPPEQPGNVYQDSTSIPEGESSGLNDLPKEIRTTELATSPTNLPTTITTTITTTPSTPSTTITTTITTSTTTPSTTFTTTTESMTTTPSTLAVTEMTSAATAPTNAQTNGSPTVVNNVVAPIAAPTPDPWRPITLGKRLQSPVPIIQYPTLRPLAEEIWKPVMGIYKPAKVPPFVSAQSPVDSNWVRPTMGGMNGNIMDIFTTRRATVSTKSVPMTTSTTTTPTPKPPQRRLVRKKIIRTTPELRTTPTITTTTEIPTKRKAIGITERRKKKKTTTVSPSTTESTTFRTTKLKVTKPKKTKRTTISTTPITTTTTITPTTTTEPTEPIAEELETDEPNDSTETEVITEEGREESEFEESVEENQDSNENTEEPKEEGDGLPSETKQDENSTPEEVPELESEEESDENIEKISETTTQENKQENGDQGDYEVEEEVIEQVEVSTKASTIILEDSVESDETNEEEVVEEEEEEIEPTEQMTIQTTTEQFDVEYEEEVEESHQDKGPAQIIKENKQEPPKKESPPLIEYEYEYEYEDVTEGPKPGPNDSEELIEEYDQDVELTTEAVSDDERDDNWQYIPFPIKRKEVLNRFPIKRS